VAAVEIHEDRLARGLHVRRIAVRKVLVKGQRLGRLSQRTPLIPHPEQRRRQVAVYGGQAGRRRDILRGGAVHRLQDILSLPVGVQRALAVAEVELQLPPAQNVAELRQRDRVLKLDSVVVGLQRGRMPADLDGPPCRL
jgi:hypothetical protein